MKLGIVGLPNVGKSTLFNAITNAGAQSANYPFCTIEPNIGVVSVPDKRLDVLCDMYKAQNLVRATIEFLDIAGLVKGASQGEGLGNKFLSHIREVDAVVHVVRCFVDDDIIHVNGQVSPEDDINIINLELVLSDIELLEKRIEKTEKLIKADKKYQKELDFLKKLKVFLEEGNLVRNYLGTEEELELLKSLPLLSNKPVIYAANLSENDFKNGNWQNEYLKQVNDIAAKEGSKVVPISARLEEELAELCYEEKQEFLHDLGLMESGVDALIKAGYSLLGLISFLTAGPKEVRAWPIKKGTCAKEAAGKIHSDIERGFIKAEIVSYKDLINCGGFNAAKEAGLVRAEGKEYIMCDGDVVLFRFNI
ncbi:MAG: redox-regulated ATPase YchF [Oscillospiraceae bacterium]